MCTEQTSAKSVIRMFFPKEPMPQSARAGETWDTHIRTALESLLRSDPSIVDGYHLIDGKGNWFDSDQSAWEGDCVCDITIYVSAEFVQEMRSPNVRNRCRQFVARVARLSCVEMGHVAFWCMLNNGLLEEWSSNGVTLAGRLLTYEQILNLEAH